METKIRNRVEAPIPIKSLTAPDGEKLIYGITSPKSGRIPLVFCYGLVCNYCHWVNQLDFFKKSHQVFYPDYRAHGHSDIPKDLTSINRKQFVEDLLWVLKQEKIERAVFLGHSLGVQVVLEVYRQNPEMVAGMILANGTAGNPCETVFNSNFQDLLLDQLTTSYPVLPKFFEKFWKNTPSFQLTHQIIQYIGFHPTLSSKNNRRQYVEMASQVPFQSFLKLFDEMRAFDGIQWIDKVKVPTLVIAGERDLIIPKENQQLIHQLIPNSEYREVPLGSHCTPVDRPGYVNYLIRDFMNRRISK